MSFSGSSFSSNPFQYDEPHPMASFPREAEYYDAPPRRSVGIRPILHAAHIFDPNFIPAPINYQPLQPIPTTDWDEILNGILEESRSRRRLMANMVEDAGYVGMMEDGPQFVENVADINNQIPYDALLDRGSFPIQQFNWDTMPNPYSMYPNNPPTYTEPYTYYPHFSTFLTPNDFASPLTSPYAPNPPPNTPAYRSDHYDSGYNSSRSTSNSSIIANPFRSGEKSPRGRFAPTDEELALLDYEGTRGRRGSDLLYACRAGQAQSVRVRSVALKRSRGLTV
ncbi:hypothetical protein ACLMJK_003512 [Lecanora helva]